MSASRKGEKKIDNKKRQYLKPVTQKKTDVV